MGFCFFFPPLEQSPAEAEATSPAAVARGHMEGSCDLWRRREDSPVVRCLLQSACGLDLLLMRAGLSGGGGSRSDQAAGLISCHGGRGRRSFPLHLHPGEEAPSPASMHRRREGRFAAGTLGKTEGRAGSGRNGTGVCVRVRVCD